MELLILSQDEEQTGCPARETLLSFGKGINIYTAGIGTDRAAEGYPYSLSFDDCTHRSWDYVLIIGSDNTAEELLSYFGKTVYGWKQMELSPSDKEQFQRNLYELYRDELKERTATRCTCGANDFCRCE